MGSFDVFWTIYPRRVGKRAASTAFERACKRATVDDILEGAQAYRDDRDRIRKGIEYTPYPATWLNQDRWLDEPAQAVETVEIDLFMENDVDDRPQCCIEAEHGFTHWLEAHATPQERAKAERLDLGRTADAP